MVYNGENLVFPKNIDNYGSCPPLECTFPEFDIEFFTPLGRSGELMGGFRWITKKIVDLYNEADILLEENEYDHFYVKILNINGQDYYFAGKYSTYHENVPLMVSIDDPTVNSETEALGELPYLINFVETD